MPRKLALALAPLVAACAVQTDAVEPLASPPTAPPPPGASIDEDDWQTLPETPANRALYDGVAVVERPGPVPRRREGKDTCDAAHNHCLHSNSWFLAGAPGLGPYQAVLVFRFEGRFYRWKDVEERDRGRAYHTVPATASNVAPGAKVLVFHPPGSDDWGPPRSAAEARDSENWGLLEVASVDAAAATFGTRAGYRGYPLALSRVVVEEVPVSP
jgi:hypothetical protein